MVESLECVKVLLEDYERVDKTGFMEIFNEEQVFNGLFSKSKKQEIKDHLEVLLAIYRTDIQLK